MGPQSSLHPRMLGATEEFPIGLHPAGESGTVVSFFHPGLASPEMFETLSLLKSRSDRWAVVRAALHQADSGSCEITSEMIGHAAEVLAVFFEASPAELERAGRRVLQETFALLPSRANGPGE